MGLRRSWRVTSSTSGVSARHTVSFTKKAERTPETSHDAGQQRQRTVRVIHHPRRDQREKSGETQVGDDDHHAEEQRDRLVVDRGVGFRSVSAFEAIIRLAPMIAAPVRSTRRPGTLPMASAR